jgi:hypothetical protein
MTQPLSAAESTGVAAAWVLLAGAVEFDGAVCLVSVATQPLNSRIPNSPDANMRFILFSLYRGPPKGGHYGNHFRLKADTTGIISA